MANKCFNANIYRKEILDAILLVLFRFIHRLRLQIDLCLDDVEFLVISAGQLNFRKLENFSLI